MSWRIFSNFQNLLQVMKFFQSLLVFLFCSVAIFGQKNLSVTGTIVDDTSKEPVDFATVSLLNAKDSSFVSGAVSDEKGIFTLRGASKGQYLVNVIYVGYKTIFKAVTLSENNPITNVGTLSLVTDAILLEETVVEGKVPEVVVKGDTIEYDADSFKTPENAALEELLKKLPGAEVDKDGNITVNGKEIKKILVEGKEFFSDDPQVASKNLPAEMVKKVQVLDRMSDIARLTGFDDGDEETIINLTIQEGMKKGTMGNAMAGMGHDILEGNNTGDWRYEAGTMVNHMTDNDRYTVLLSGNNTNNMGASDLGARRFGGMRGMRRGSGGINTSENFAANLNKEFSPKFSLNGDISYNGSDRVSDNKTETEYDESKNSGMKLKERTESKNNDISDNFNVSFRLEWKPDTATTFIFRPNFSYNKSNSTEDRSFGSFNMLAPLGKDTLFDGSSHSYNWGEGYQTGATLEFARQLSKPGRVISASINGNYNTSYSDGEYNYRKHIYNNGIQGRDSVVKQQLLNDSYSTSYGFSVTYVEPIGRSNFLQLSYRFNNNYSEDKNTTYDSIPKPGMPNQWEWEQDSVQSRSNVRYNLTQRINLSFKAVREKYNYTIGLNVDPSSSTNDTYVPFPDKLLAYPFDYANRLPNVMGDSLDAHVLQNKPRISPTVNFNYLFGPRTNLRVDYSGNMTQPTANQLSFFDDSDPMNIIEGNPDLKPSYSNNFSARFSKFVPESQFFYNIMFRGSFTLDDIVQVRTIAPTGGKSTTYKNINGNWNAQLRGMFNTPLRNKKFTIGSFSRLSYQNLEGYTNGDRNTTKNFTVSERANVNYRSDLFDLGITGEMSYQNVNNRLQPQNSRNTYDYSAGGYTTWYLPYDITIESDISWQRRIGYDAGFNTNQTIWNAAVSKQIFNSAKAGAGVIKLRIYDILQDRKSLSYTVGNGFITNRESTALTSFFMCSFIYKFQVFPGGNASSEDMQNEFGGRGRGMRGRGQR